MCDGYTYGSIVLDFGERLLIFLTQIPVSVAKKMIRNIFCLFPAYPATDKHMVKERSSTAHPAELSGGLTL